MACSVPGADPRKYAFLPLAESGSASRSTPNGSSRVKVNTIFEDSPISLDKWLACRLDDCQLQERRFPFYEIHRAIGVTQKSTWFMMHRIRLGSGGWHLS